MNTKVSKNKVLLVKSMSILGLVLAILGLASRFFEDSRFLNAFHNSAPISFILITTALVLSNRFEKEAASKSK